MVCKNPLMGDFGANSLQHAGIQARAKLVLHVEVHVFEA
jgi:hypothetical protein